MSNIKYTGNPTSPALIFLHGFMGDSTDWDPVISRLKTSFHCITIELPGHGSSQNVLSKESFFRTLSGLIRSDIQSPSLIGYSMGGRILLEYLLKYPEIHSLIRKVIIESSHPGIDGPEQEPRICSDEIFFKDIKNDHNLQDLLRKWYSRPLFGKIMETPGFFERVKSKKVSSVEQWQKSLNLWSVGNQPSCWELLTKLDNIFYIYGEEDVKYKKIGLKINTRSFEIKKAAHNTHIEQPDSYIKLIKLLLEK